MDKDNYKILGLDDDATMDEVKQAYKKLTTKYSATKSKKNTEKLNEVKEAYTEIKEEYEEEKRRKLEKKSDKKTTIEKDGNEDKSANKKFLIVVGVLVALILLPFVAELFNKSNSGYENLVEKTYAGAYEVYSGETKSVLYITDTETSLEYDKVVNSAAAINHITVYKVNKDELSDAELEDLFTIEEINKYLDSNEPILIVVKEKEVLDIMVGLKTENELEDFFDKNEIMPIGIIGISLSKYLNLIKSPINTIIYVGRETCGYCKQAEPTLDEIAKERRFTIYYLDTDTLVSDEEYNTLLQSHRYFTEEDWGTPLLLIFKNSEIVGASVGYKEKSEFVNFFSGYGF